MRFLPKRKAAKVDALKKPKHLAVIMDGNGRWAQRKGLPRVAGHRAGAESVKQIVESCKKLSIPYLTLYAFSYENWQRPQQEVDALMDLLLDFLKERLPDMVSNNICLKAIGRLDMLSQAVQDQLNAAIEATANNTEITIILALSYGGREEIVDAASAMARDAVSGALDLANITNETFSSYLYTAKIPDPDLLIRTSGEVRLSNFLLWQLSYAEIIITDRLWPDFRHKELVDALAEFSLRDRRFGKI